MQILAAPSSDGQNMIDRDEDLSQMLREMAEEQRDPLVRIAIERMSTDRSLLIDNFEISAENHD